MTHVLSLSLCRCEFLSLKTKVCEFVYLCMFIFVKIICFSVFAYFSISVFGFVTTLSSVFVSCNCVIVLCNCVLVVVVEQILIKIALHYNLLLSKSFC